MMDEDIESVMIKVEVDDVDDILVENDPFELKLESEPKVEHLTTEVNSILGPTKGRAKKNVTSDGQPKVKRTRKSRAKKVAIQEGLPPNTQNNSDSDCNTDMNDIPKLRKARPINQICTFCGMKFKRFMDLERHVYRHTGIRNYTCTECDALFITTNDLKKHIQSHAIEANFPCDICPDKKFRTVMSLRAHVKLCHGDKETDYKNLCTECGVRFRTASTLWMHKRRIHSDIRKFKCEICHKGFCKQMELTNHMASHSDFREYKCDLCPAEYKKKVTLQMHKTEKHGLGYHTKEKCTGSKNQVCPYCSERFGLREHLQFHIRRKHTGVKPYQCSLCQKSFIRKNYVKDHLKRKHHMTVEQIALGDYIISDEMPITMEMSLAPNDYPNIASLPPVIPEVVYKDESISDMEDEDYAGGAINFMV